VQVFRRGDTNDDGVVDIADLLFMVEQDSIPAVNARGHDGAHPPSKRTSTGCQGIPEGERAPSPFKSTCQAIREGPPNFNQSHEQEIGDVHHAVIVRVAPAKYLHAFIGDAVPVGGRPTVRLESRTHRGCRWRCSHGWCRRLRSQTSSIPLACNREKRAAPTALERAGIVDTHRQVDPAVAVQVAHDQSGC